jgi:hypothetical protein
MPIARINTGGEGERRRVQQPARGVAEIVQEGRHGLTPRSVEGTNGGSRALGGGGHEEVEGGEQPEAEHCDGA